jgi:KDO2-lipid IV(A) lauroyltransferase
MDFKDLRRAWRYRAGRFLVEGTARLPIAVGRRLYGFFGRAAFLLVGRDRRLALANLSQAFPEWSEDRVIREALQVFQELTKNIYDVAAFVRWPEAVRNRQLRISGTAHLDRALEDGRGAILLGNHQGAWELVAVALERAGYPIEAFSRPVSEPRLDRWLESHRRALGITTLPRDGLSAALRARRLLRKGGLVAVLLDHRIRKGGLLVDFFGRPARFAAGPVRLALRSGAPLLPVRIGRDTSGAHMVEIAPPVLRPEAGLTPCEATSRLLRDSVRELEDMIRRSPTEWAWIHPRWSEGPKVERVRRPVFARIRSAWLLLVFAVVAVSGCGPSRPSDSSGPEYSGPSSALGGFKLSETESGRLRWILRADSAETFDNTMHETVVTNVHVDFYNAERQIYSVLTADKGVVEESTNDMSASGHVRIETQDGDTLTTETLEWHNTPGRVRTAEPFRLARPDVVLTGTGFESDPGLKQYTTEDVRIDARRGTSANSGS